MRALKYRLTNGTVVTTLKEAQSSGQGYATFLENIVEKPFALSPIRKAMLKQFGYVSPRLKNSLKAKS